MRFRALVCTVNFIFGLMYGLAMHSAHTLHWTYLCSSGATEGLHSIYSLFVGREVFRSVLGCSGRSIEARFGPPIFKNRFDVSSRNESGFIAATRELWVYDFGCFGLMLCFSNSCCYEVSYLSAQEVCDVCVERADFLSGWCLNRSASDIAWKVGDYDLYAEPFKLGNVRSGKVGLVVGDSNGVTLTIKDGICTKVSRFFIFH